MNIHRLQQGLVRRINALRPVRLSTAASLAAEDPSCWRSVYPAWQAKWPEYLPSGPLPAAFRERLSHKLPAKGVLQLRNASVIGDHGWVFTDRGTRVDDTTNYVNDPTWAPRVHLPLLQTKARRLPGRTLSLLTNWGSTNFFHMQIDAIPRADMLFQAGWKWSDFNQILLPSFKSPTITRQLEKLGLPMEKTIPVHWGPLNYFHAEELVCTSYPGGRRTVLPPTINYLRRLNAPSASGGGKRIFVRRIARTRHLRNEHELLPLLLARNFEIIDPQTHPDVEGAFHGAEYVVGAHGASLANLVFCRPGAKVLELVPSDQAFPFFFTIAVHGGLGYDCVIGRSDHETPNPPGQTWNSPSDFTVDARMLETALDRLLG